MFIEIEVGFWSLVWIDLFYDMPTLVDLLNTEASLFFFNELYGFK